MSSIQDRLLAAVAENAQLKSDAAALTKRLNKAEKKTNGVEATTKKVRSLPCVEPKIVDRHLVKQKAYCMVRSCLIGSLHACHS